MKRIRWKPLLGAATGLALLLAWEGSASGDVVLSDNLGGAIGNTELVSGNRWMTASFGTDSQSYLLNAVTLMLYGSGTAQLNIYGDNAGHPGTLLGTLNSPASYPGSLSTVTFDGNPISLSANAIYWSVLRAQGGSFYWAWTTSNTGSGVGFQGKWGNSSDAGSSWTVFTEEPQMMGVTATPVPEASTLVAGGILILPFVLQTWLVARNRWLV